MSKLIEYAVLYVDDEEMSLKYFEKQFSKDFDIFTATSAAAGWEILEQQEGKIGVAISDQRMPGQTGVELLERARHRFPHMIRILVTAYSDMESAIAGVNAGAIYKYISKPWDVTDLRFTLLRALEFYQLLREKDQLLREKLAVVHRIVLCDRIKNLAVLAAGLSAQFRFALQAARAFAAAVPRVGLAPAAESSFREDSAKNLERLLHRSSQDVFYVADAMKKMAGSPSAFSEEPLRWETLLGPIHAMNSAEGAKPVALKIQPALPGLKANSSQIAQLLSLLVSHLSTMAEAGAPISVEVTKAPAPEGANRVRIQFSDPGSDWNLGQRIRFFAPFAACDQSTDNLGLDLAVCYFLVHHHAGRITVPGQQRSRVVIDLPADPLERQADALQSNQLADLFLQEIGFA